MTDSLVFWVSIDGEFVEPNAATVSVLDRGFLYGDSVFEVLRTYDGKPFGLSAHLERLARSGERIGIELSVSRDRIAGEVRELLDRAAIDDAYVRIIVTRGIGPLTYDPSSARSPRRIVIVAPLPEAFRIPPDGQRRDAGVAIELFPSGRTPSASSLAEAKASNYLANLLAVQEAKQRGADEAIFVGRAGEVLEGASSNIFRVVSGRIETPRVGGILSGITRAAVLKLAAERYGEPSERLLFPSDLYSADEIFITSSIREVVPVVRIDGKVVGRGNAGPVTLELRAAFRDYARREASKEPSGSLSES